MTFDPAESADGTTPQITAQAYLPVSGYAQYYVDNSYYVATGTTATTNSDVTVAQNGTSVTATPASGYCGVQVLDVSAQAATTPPWDSAVGVSPQYQAAVPVYVAPPAPQIASITAGGQPVTGSTSATSLSFDIAGVSSSDTTTATTVSVYMDGGSTPIATGTLAAGDTTVTLPNVTVPAGSHQFTVEQTITTLALTVYDDWSTASGQLEPGSQYAIASTNLTSPASAATSLTIT